MHNSFLEYYKTILEKVSFDYQLLKKEYNKAIRMLSVHEIQMLNQWLESKGFNFHYGSERTVFAKTEIPIRG